MEESLSKQSKLQNFYTHLRSSIFNIMLELLKEKKTGKWYCCFIMLIMFVQLVGLLFDSDNDFAWEDDFLLDVFSEVCNFFRLLPTIQKAESPSFYWILYFFGISLVITIIGLLIYTNYSLSIKKFYFVWPVNILKTSLVFLYWALYGPFLESLISIFNCENGNHYIDTNLACYDGLHIFFVILSIIFAILLFFICFLSALFYNETQNVQEDALARLENSFEVELLIYRTIVIIFSNFCYNQVCSWMLIIVFLMCSIMLCYQYYKYIPYYNSFVSVFWGSLIYCYFWFSLNALLMQILNVYGHLIIIFIGVPIISALVKNLREKRIEDLLLTNVDKLKLDVDALIQIYTVQKLVKGGNINHVDEVTLIGIVNLHILECQNLDCPCKNDSELYDAVSDKFSDRSLPCNKDIIFLHHFNKRLYEDALNKFINSPSLHIAFAFYLFETMRNVHASLVELNISEKKKPSLQQQFTIFRNKKIIENHIKVDSTQSKDIYTQLTNVIEFERLLTECQKAIEKVCNFQIEFWSQLANILPDLNILNDLGKKIYTSSEEAEDFWLQLCKINPNYSKALTLYGYYLVEIKNHNQRGYDLLEKAKSTYKKSLDELVKSADILFDDDTSVVHVSGNKETAGRILKTNQGLTKIFGYNKSEVIGHSVNILMPSIFAKRHAEFMDKFFRTARHRIFNNERYLYALHRNGYCFNIKLLVKQMPSLSEGIQYVGMIRRTQADYEYILTDMRGVVDCFSMGISSLLNLTCSLFKDTEINLQVLAPELIKVFSSVDKKRPLLEKFKEPGGQKLTFIVPKDFVMHTQAETKKNTKEFQKGGKGKGGALNTGAMKNSRAPIYRNFNKMLNKPNGVPTGRQLSPRKLTNSPEYKEHDAKATVKCEIIDLSFGVTKDFEPLKVRVFKISGISMKNLDGGSQGDSSEGEGEGESQGYYEGGGYKREMNPPQMPGDPQSAANMGGMKQMRPDAILKYILPPGKKEEEEKKSESHSSSSMHSSSQESEEVKGEGEDKEREKPIEALATDMMVTEQAPRPIFKGVGIDANVKSELRDIIIQPEPSPQVPPSNEGGGLISGDSFGAEGKEGKSVKESESSAIDVSDFDESNLVKDEAAKSGSPKEKKLDNISVPLLDLSVDQSPDDKAKNLFLLAGAEKGGEGELETHEDAIETQPMIPPLKMKAAEVEEESESRSETLSKKSSQSSSQSSSKSEEKPAGPGGEYFEQPVTKPKGGNKFRTIYPSKIITNPIYQGNEFDWESFQEYKQTESEIKLRRALLQAEKKKNKQKKEEAQKEKKEKEKGEEEEEEGEEGAKEGENEEGEEKEGKEGKEEGDDDEEENQETQSSVTSGSTGSTIRSFYSLRTAIDERFVPRSIRNLRCAAMIIFALLIALAIVYFSIQITLFDKINLNIKNIHYSEKRLNYIIDINLRIMNLMLIQHDDGEECGTKYWAIPGQNFSSPFKPVPYEVESEGEGEGESETEGETETETETETGARNRLLWGNILWGEEEFKGGRDNRRRVLVQSIQSTVQDVNKLTVTFTDPVSYPSAAATFPCDSQFFALSDAKLSTLLGSECEIRQDTGTPNLLTIYIGSTGKIRVSDRIPYKSSICSGCELTLSTELPNLTLSPKYTKFLLLSRENIITPSTSNIGGATPTYTYTLSPPFQCSSLSPTYPPGTTLTIPPNTLCLHPDTSRPYILIVRMTLDSAYNGFHREDYMQFWVTQVVPMEIVINKGHSWDIGESAECSLSWKTVGDTTYTATDTTSITWGIHRSEVRDQVGESLSIGSNSLSVGMYWIYLVVEWDVKHATSFLPTIYTFSFTIAATIPQSNISIQNSNLYIQLPDPTPSITKCKEIFTPETVQLLGEGAKCTTNANRNLTVMPGPFASPLGDQFKYVQFHEELSPKEFIVPSVPVIPILTATPPSVDWSEESKKSVLLESSGILNQPVGKKFWWVCVEGPEILPSIGITIGDPTATTLVPGTHFTMLGEYTMEGNFDTGSNLNNYPSRRVSFTYDIFSPVSVSIEGGGYVMETTSIIDPTAYGFENNCNMVSLNNSHTLGTSPVCSVTPGTPNIFKITPDQADTDIKFGDIVSISTASFPTTKFTFDPTCVIGGLDNPNYLQSAGPLTLTLTCQGIQAGHTPSPVYAFSFDTSPFDQTATQLGSGIDSETYEWNLELTIPGVYVVLYIVTIDGHSFKHTKSVEIHGEFTYTQIFSRIDLRSSYPMPTFSSCLDIFEPNEALWEVGIDHCTRHADGKGITIYNPMNLYYMGLHTLVFTYQEFYPTSSITKLEEFGVWASCTQSPSTNVDSGDLSLSLNTYSSIQFVLNERNGRTVDIATLGDTVEWSYMHEMGGSNGNRNTVELLLANNTDLDIAGRWLITVSVTYTIGTAYHETQETFVHKFLFAVTTVMSSSSIKGDKISFTFPHYIIDTSDVPMEQEACLLYVETNGDKLGDSMYCFYNSGTKSLEYYIDVFESTLEAADIIELSSYTYGEGASLTLPQSPATFSLPPSSWDAAIDNALSVALGNIVGVDVRYVWSGTQPAHCALTLPVENATGITYPGGTLCPGTTLFTPPGPYTLTLTLTFGDHTMEHTFVWNVNATVNSFLETPQNVTFTMNTVFAQTTDCSRHLETATLVLFGSAPVCTLTPNKMALTIAQGGSDILLQMGDELVLSYDVVNKEQTIHQGIIPIIQEVNKITVKFVGNILYPSADSTFICDDKFFALTNNRIRQLLGSDCEIRRTTDPGQMELYLGHDARIRIGKQLPLASAICEGCAIELRENLPELDIMEDEYLMVYEEYTITPERTGDLGIIPIFTYTLDPPYQCSSITETLTLPSGPSITFPPLSLCVHPTNSRPYILTTRMQYPIAYNNFYREKDIRFWVTWVAPLFINIDLGITWDIDQSAKATLHWLGSYDEEEFNKEATLTRGWSIRELGGVPQDVEVYDIPAHSLTPGTYHCLYTVTWRDLYIQYALPTQYSYTFSVTHLITTILKSSFILYIQLPDPFPPITSCDQFFDHDTLTLLIPDAICTTDGDRNLTVIPGKKAVPPASNKFTYVQFREELTPSEFTTQGVPDIIGASATPTVVDYTEVNRRKVVLDVTAVKNKPSTGVFTWTCVSGPEILVEVEIAEGDPRSIEFVAGSNLTKLGEYTMKASFQSGEDLNYYPIREVKFKYEIISNIAVSFHSEHYFILLTTALDLSTMDLADDCSMITLSNSHSLGVVGNGPECSIKGEGNTQLEIKPDSDSNIAFGDVLTIQSSSFPLTSFIFAPTCSVSGAQNPSYYQSHAPLNIILVCVAMEKSSPVYSIEFTEDSSNSNTTDELGSLTGPNYVWNLGETIPGRYTLKYTVSISGNTFTYTHTVTIFGEYTYTQTFSRIDLRSSYPMPTFTNCSHLFLLNKALWEIRGHCIRHADGKGIAIFDDKILFYEGKNTLELRDQAYYPNSTMGVLGEFGMWARWTGNPEYNLDDGELTLSLDSEENIVFNIAHLNGRGILNADLVEWEYKAQVYDNSFFKYTTSLSTLDFLDFAGVWLISVKVVYKIGDALTAQNTFTYYHKFSFKVTTILHSTAIQGDMISFTFEHSILAKQDLLSLTQSKCSNLIKTGGTKLGESMSCNYQNNTRTLTYYFDLFESLFVAGDTLLLDVKITYAVNALIIIPQAPLSMVTPNSPWNGAVDNTISVLLGNMGGIGARYSWTGTNPTSCTFPLPPADQVSITYPGGTLCPVIINNTHADGSYTFTLLVAIPLINSREYNKTYTFGVSGSVVGSEQKQDSVSFTMNTVFASTNVCGRHAVDSTIALFGTAPVCTILADKKTFNLSKGGTGATLNEDSVLAIKYNVLNRQQSRQQSIQSFAHSVNRIVINFVEEITFPNSVDTAFPCNTSIFTSGTIPYLGSGCEVRKEGIKQMVILLGYDTSLQTTTPIIFASDICVIECGYQISDSLPALAVSPSNVPFWKTWESHTIQPTGTDLFGQVVQYSYTVTPPVACGPLTLTNGTNAVIHAKLLCREATSSTPYTVKVTMTFTDPNYNSFKRETSITFLTKPGHITIDRDSNTWAYTQPAIATFTFLTTELDLSKTDSITWEVAQKPAVTATGISISLPGNTFYSGDYTLKCTIQWEYAKWTETFEYSFAISAVIPLANLQQDKSNYMITLLTPFIPITSCSDFFNAATVTQLGSRAICRVTENILTVKPDKFANLGSTATYTHKIAHLTPSSFTLTQIPTLVASTSADNVDYVENKTVTLSVTHANTANLNKWAFISGPRVGAYPGTSESDSYTLTPGSELLWVGEYKAEASLQTGSTYNYYPTREVSFRYDTISGISITQAVGGAFTIVITTGINLTAIDDAGITPDCDLVKVNGTPSVAPAIFTACDIITDDFTFQMVSNPLSTQTLRYGDQISIATSYTSGNEDNTDFPISSFIFKPSCAINHGGPTEYTQGDDQLDIAITCTAVDPESTTYLFQFTDTPYSQSLPQLGTLNSNTFTWKLNSSIPGNYNAKFLVVINGIQFPFQKLFKLTGELTYTQTFGRIDYATIYPLPSFSSCSDLFLNNEALAEIGNDYCVYTVGKGLTIYSPTITNYLGTNKLVLKDAEFYNALNENLEPFYMKVKLLGEETENIDLKIVDLTKDIDVVKNYQFQIEVEGGLTVAEATYKEWIFYPVAKITPPFVNETRDTTILSLNNNVEHELNIAARWWIKCTLKWNVGTPNTDPPNLELSYLFDLDLTTELGSSSIIGDTVSFTFTSPVLAHHSPTAPVIPIPKETCGSFLSSQDIFSKMGNSVECSYAPSSKRVSYKIDPFESRLTIGDIISLNEEEMYGRDGSLTLSSVPLATTLIIPDGGVWEAGENNTINVSRSNEDTSINIGYLWSVDILPSDCLFPLPLLNETGRLYEEGTLCPGAYKVHLALSVAPLPTRRLLTVTTPNIYDQYIDFNMTAKVLNFTQYIDGFSFTMDTVFPDNIWCGRHLTTETIELLGGVEAEIESETESECEGECEGENETESGGTPGRRMQDATPTHFAKCSLSPDKKTLRVYVGDQASLTLGHLVSLVYDIEGKDQRLQMRVSCAGNSPNTVSNKNWTTKTTQYEETKIQLKSAATLLKDAQTELSLKTSRLSSESLEKINPENVKLMYMATKGMQPSYMYTIWQAIMEIVVSAYRITTMDRWEINRDNDPTVYFVTYNSLNSVMLALEMSTNAIIDETEDSRQLNIQIFQVLLIVVSTSLALSLVFLLPVINKVKKNKSEVLELFMHVKKKEIEAELTKCRKFLAQFQSSNETEMVGGEEAEGENKDDEDDDLNQDPMGAKMGGPTKKSRYSSSKSNRKYKKLVANMGILFFKFIFLILLIEGYFVMIYLFSSTFLGQVSNLTEELQLLISRLPTHSFLLLIQKEVIFRELRKDRDQSFIKLLEPVGFVTSYHEKLYDEEEELLDIFSSNFDYHTSEYNTDFNNLIFSDVCQYVNEFKDTTAKLNECQTFNQGILTKGIYSSVIKYWDFLRQLNHDFGEALYGGSYAQPKVSGPVLQNYISKFLNEDRLTTAEKMQDYYFKVSLNYLVKRLEDDIDTFFEKEMVKNRTLFIIYLLYIFVVYVFMWRRFVNEMQNELWKTKSILSILPPDMIMNIQEIKNFILSNSSTVFFSKSTHK